MLWSPRHPTLSGMLIHCGEPILGRHSPIITRSRVNVAQSYSATEYMISKLIEFDMLSLSLQRNVLPTVVLHANMRPTRHVTYSVHIHPFPHLGHARKPDQIWSSDHRVAHDTSHTNQPLSVEAFHQVELYSST